MANLFGNHFRSGREENERQMANNVMQEMRVYDGYLVGLTWRRCPRQRRQNSFLLLPKLVLVFFLENERVMQQSRDKYFPQFENQGINAVGEERTNHQYVHK